MSSGYTTHFSLLQLFTDLWVILPLSLSLPYSLHLFKDFNSWLTITLSFFYLDYNIHVYDPSNLGFLFLGHFSNDLILHLIFITQALVKNMEFINANNTIPSKPQFKAYYFATPQNPSPMFATHFL